MQVLEYFKSPIFRLTQTMRRTKTPGGTMATGTLSIPTRRTKLARLLPTWRLTCVSEIARLGRVVSKWTRWMSRRLKSITGTGRSSQVFDNQMCLQYFVFHLNFYPYGSGTMRTRLQFSVLGREEKR